jgi:hypothetical protein
LASNPLLTSFAKGHISIEEQIAAIGSFKRGGVITICNERDRELKPAPLQHASNFYYAVARPNVKAPARAEAHFQLFHPKVSPELNRISMQICYRCFCECINDGKGQRLRSFVE